ncbi:uncharacterized protein LOC112571470 [Pomacea canaliculata]|uniref:uncharacterized protein LOC112571470 n=1 Tax=Pomacea canaliculata TaxID=400727 RepID=UPI000D726FA9|nr:uncharacterized protein LOC112571470 [Pomacea canaliculata]
MYLSSHRHWESKRRQMAVLSSVTMDWKRLCLSTCFLISFSSVAYSQVVTQETLSYMGKYLVVKYQVIDNFRDTLKTYQAQITLVNSGTKPIPARGWAIFFCQGNLVEPKHHPYPEGVLLEDQGIRFRHYQGCVFSFEPDGIFEDIPSGATRTFRFLSENFSVARTDTYPNWYVAAPGLEARVIANTAGETLEWVGAFDKENKWKRYDYKTEEAEGHDRYDPYTPAARYEVNRVSDLNGAPKHVIPTPVELKVNGDGFLQLNTKDWTIFAPEQFSNEARILGEYLGIVVSNTRRQSRTIVFKVADVKVTVDGKELSTKEAYELTVDVTNDVIEIKAKEPEGAFYGAMTLLNLKDEKGRVPEVSVMDAPRFSYRGLMLDVGRNFHPVEDVLRLLDVMSRYKLNTFHFHLTDDEGWRIEIPELPELTQVAGRRCHDLEENECLLPFQGSGPTSSPRGSGFYTVEDYKRILRYAAQRHIRVIPEVDMPGHGHASIKAMEARRRKLLKENDEGANRYVLVDDDDPSWYKSIQLYTDNAVNPCLSSTYNFVNTVVQTLVEVHRDVMPLTIYHFGGDEVAKGAWQNSTACDVLLTSGFDFRNYKDLKEYFVRQVSNITSRYGLDLAAWEDGVMESGSTPYTRSELQNNGVYAYTWDNVWEWGVAGRAYKLANAGYKVIMAQATHLYFDHPYEPDPEERGLYWAPRFTNTRKTFSFMPSDLYANADVDRSGNPIEHEDLCGEDGEDCPKLKKPENIFGMQGHLWSEAIRTRQQADYMLFPRFLALAERAWHEASWERNKSDNLTRIREREKDWTDFANTLGYRELARLDDLGIEYRIPPPGAKLTHGTIVTNVAFPGLRVEYSSDSGVTWCDVKDNMSVSPGSTILLRTRSATGGRHSRVVSLRVSGTQAGSATRTAPLGLVFITFIFSLMRIF